jgi:hypothetical protein
MQVQLDDIAGGEPLLREVGQEEFVDDPCPCDPNRALLFAHGMGRDDHAVRHTLRPDRHLWTVVEAAHHLAFRALLELIGR